MEKTGVVMKRRMFRLMVIFLLLVSVISGGILGGFPAKANPADSEEDDEENEYDKLERELEEKRQNALNEIKSLKSDITSVEGKIKELQAARSDLQTYIKQLDSQVNALAAQIKELEEQIEEKKAEIAQKEEELAAAEKEAQEQYDMMKKRICYMYEKGEDSFFVMLLESGSLAEMLNRADYAMQMSEYDRQMKDSLKEVRDTIEEYKELLEKEKEEQEGLLGELESQKEAVNRAISAKTQEIASYQSQINTASGEEGEYKKQLAEQEKLLQQVENQIASVAAARAAAEDGDGGASGFLWPCPVSHRITSGFGLRDVPMAGASANHRGIDIGAPSGSAIVAAASGRVTTSTYNYSAGNYIVVSHGNGISTVYMHASALYVSEGEMVAQGQKIAAVGSTGYSTGPHLHFGVIVNGSYVNPLNYVH